MLPNVTVPVVVFKYTVTFSIPVVLSPTKVRVLVIAGTWNMPGDGLVMLLVSALTVQENCTVFSVGPVPPPLAVTYPVSVYVMGTAKMRGVATTAMNRKHDNTIRRRFILCTGNSLYFWF
jgi:hypothetical protein